MFFALVGLVLADIPVVPHSLSPDGKIHAVMDVDRDQKISPEWKGDSFPEIEITNKESGEVLVSIEYFGSAGVERNLLREHVKLTWRDDSKAFGVTIVDRFYSACSVYAVDKDGKFNQVAIPTDYKILTGFPKPDVKYLRARGRDQIDGWDKDGLLIYSIFRSPLHTFKGKDPLRHRVFLELSSNAAKPVKVEHEKGEWRNGDWVLEKAEQGAGSQH